ncbi:YaaR family protein [Virgibacillus alimentarius]|uniref:Uncharacterized protein YaaR (DUF327 family) n=1 Tax=Virgibacillus alimentarius TaxID=698769 RepID=A0ABS4S6L2_9BACI|nr:MULTISPECIES: YaaR family protein [Virgibacillus]MBP2257108.1 uncharacterized protein YaaR (DUF327 family) [Virgibacillus alimentarius]HLR68819.1 YaaR family protein [Virgibacillus sp.]
MKISQEMRSQIETTFNRTAGKSKQGFDRMVQSQTHQLRQQAIEQLIRDITHQGEKLAHFRSFKDLVKFKHMIKDLLQETVSNGLDIKKSYRFNYGGQNHELSIIKEVDEKLIALTEEMMNHEKKSVDLLGMIGEIKGLLVNLYM